MKSEPLAEAMTSGLDLAPLILTAPIWGPFALLLGGMVAATRAAVGGVLSQ